MESEGEGKEVEKVEENMKPAGIYSTAGPLRVTSVVLDF